MEADWNGHKLAIKGNWTARWLFMAPDYELWIDDEKVDRTGGPRLHPKLEAIIEDEEGELHHIEAELLSIMGWRPSCELTVEGELLKSDRVLVENIINPFLVLVILISTVIMLYVGPTVLRRFLD